MSEILLRSDAHKAALLADAKRQLDLFAVSPRKDAGFYVLDREGKPMPTDVQELHTTTRLVHSYAIAKLAGFDDCDAIIDHGMAYLTSHHRDTQHGGYVWSVEGDAPKDDRKLCYGHVFVLLAASSAMAVGHPDAKALMEDVTEILNTKFWDDEKGLFADEWNRDWTPFSTYRGMNSNMHAVEAHLAAYEASGQAQYLEKAGRILSFFMGEMAPQHGWRLPEHYTADWQVDKDYSEDPKFRPAGTTPGHSFELARLLLQYWDLRGRPDDGSVETARKVGYQALLDGWNPTGGGICYTLQHGGAVDIPARLWWPVTEAIGFMASLIKLDALPEDVTWYAKLWGFADAHFIDKENGGWFPEIDAEGVATDRQFPGKPDIYHALQADLLPLTSGLSGYYTTLTDLRK